ncbi:MAG TPA: hypothetical protein VL358_09975 [Caulobacteraceae bacterium]|jgi:hypothetical protein|nr:hypothetical protein [Caulobacteraceae bacterium]
MPLDAAILAQADRGPILNVLSTVGGKPAADWLTAGHLAADGQLPRTWKKVADAGLVDAHFVEVCAIAGPNHCIDGWSYAARALSAILAGDFHAARHLAYYAQLRAGLSILAGLGIGIFNKINFIIDASGAMKRLDTGKQGVGTHTIVWQALEAWAGDPSTAVAFVDLMRIKGTTLREALDSIWPSFSPTTVAGALIEGWGLDLKRGEREHVYRNISSYAPQGLNPLAQSAVDVVQFVEEAWRLFEPHGGAGFDELDRHLLRSMLHKLRSIVEDEAQPIEEGSIGTRYEYLPPAIQSLASLEFLRDTSVAGEPNLLRLARSTADPAMPLEMMARALLLLRTATAFTHSNFADAGIDSAQGQLNAWLHEMAVQRGFWPPGTPTAPADLWDDVELALIDFADAAAPPPACFHDWLGKPEKGLPVLAQAERITLWSLTA